MAAEAAAAEQAAAAEAAVVEEAKRKGSLVSALAATDDKDLSSRSIGRQARPGGRDPRARGSGRPSTAPRLLATP